MQLNNPSLPVQKRMSGSRLGYTGCVCVCVCVCGRGGGGYCHMWAIYVCAAVKGMVLKQFTLG